MNHAVAVDASVAVKWVIDEPHTDLALKLWADSAMAGRAVIAAPHFEGEVANAVFERVRTTDPLKHLDANDAEETLARFLAYPVEMISPPGLIYHAFAFAQAHDLPSIYDSLYVVTARLADVDLWTADNRLLTALGGRATWVHYIGDYS